MKVAFILCFAIVNVYAMNVHRVEHLEPTSTRIVEATPRVYNDWRETDEDEDDGEEVQSRMKKFERPSFLNLPYKRQDRDDDSQPPAIERGMRGLW